MLEHLIDRHDSDGVLAERNRELLAQVFAAKRVDRSLLRIVDKYREFHRTSYDSVVATLKAGFTPKDFDFYVDFEFKSRILQKVIEVLFGEAVRRMVGAFESRAEQLYGPRTPDPAGKPAV